MKVLAAGGSATGIPLTPSRLPDNGGAIMSKTSPSPSSKTLGL